jgi:hypothetical protein
VAIILFTITAAIALSFLGVMYGVFFINSLGVSVTIAKIISEILFSFFQIIAIIIAGIWAYEQFIINREEYPYPRIEQRCEHYVLEKCIVYLTVFVTVTNQGKTKLDLNGAKIIIRQVSPLLKEVKAEIERALQDLPIDDIRSGNVDTLFLDDGQRLAWITLGSRNWESARGKINELEPGQTREYQFDFILPEDDIKVIEAISYFKNKESAWEISTVYSLDSEVE